MGYFQTSILIILMTSSMATAASRGKSCRLWLELISSPSLAQLRDVELSTFDLGSQNTPKGKGQLLEVGKKYFYLDTVTKAVEPINVGKSLEGRASAFKTTNGKIYVVHADRTGGLTVYDGTMGKILSPRVKLKKLFPQFPKSILDAPESYLYQDKNGDLNVVVFPGGPLGIGDEDDSHIIKFTNNPKGWEKIDKQLLLDHTVGMGLYNLKTRRATTVTHLANDTINGEWKYYGYVHGKFLASYGYSEDFTLFNVSSGKVITRITIPERAINGDKLFYAKPDGSQYLLSEITDSPQGTTTFMEINIKNKNKKIYKMPTGNLALQFMDQGTVLNLKNGQTILVIGAITLDSQKKGQSNLDKLYVYNLSTQQSYVVNIKKTDYTISAVAGATELTNGQIEAHVWADANGGFVSSLMTIPIDLRTP